MTIKCQITVAYTRIKFDTEVEKKKSEIKAWEERQKIRNSQVR